MPHAPYCLECDQELADVETAQTHLDDNPGHHVVDAQTG